MGQVVASEYRVEAGEANSSMVTTWTVSAADAGVSTVRARTTWTGASGIGGFFERTFAPNGLAGSRT